MTVLFSGTKTCNLGLKRLKHLFHCVIWLKHLTEVAIGTFYWDQNCESVVWLLRVTSHNDQHSAQTCRTLPILIGFAHRTERFQELWMTIFGKDFFLNWRRNTYGVIWYKSHELAAGHSLQLYSIQWGRKLQIFSSPEPKVESWRNEEVNGRHSVGIG